VISAASDPGRLGVSAYTYFHVPMVAAVSSALVLLAAATLVLVVALWDMRAERAKPGSP
jgi:low temperature requirement protein LtrA